MEFKDPSIYENDTHLIEIIKQNFPEFKDTNAENWQLTM